MLKKIVLAILFITTVLNATAPTKESVAELYIATFDRAPDASGLEYWLGTGSSIENIAASFFDQEETQLKYPDGTTAIEFVTAVYVNLFNRPPERAGLIYWKEEVESGRIHRSLFILSVINGAQRSDQTVLYHRTTVGIAFADAQLNDAKDAECVIAGVTENYLTLVRGLNKVEELVNGNPCTADWTVQNYIDAGITGVTEENLDEVNIAVTNLGLDLYDPADREEIQAIVDKINNPVSDQDSFITTWKTDNQGPGYDDQVVIMTREERYTYDYNIDWGDGEINTGVTGDTNHFYRRAGTYTIKISGTFPAFYLSEDDSNYKLLYINQWGKIKWKSMEQAFLLCRNVQSIAKDAPDLSGVRSMMGMFAAAEKFNQDINDWDVSYVNNMYGTFSSALAFNHDLNGWDVSNVTDMSLMFLTSGFNGRVEQWDVSNVTDMSLMFGESAFNQDISGWDVSSVTDMYSMFGESAFNRDISGWDVSSVTDMSMMFHENAFNQDISGWDVSSVTDMYLMFYDSAFNQDISGWDVSSVTDMYSMFEESVFNRDISGWDVSSVTDMSGMFAAASAFTNHNLGVWDVSSVTKHDDFFTHETGAGNIEPNWP
ncbi:MAG: BspA family leucine-rich repeat surface protein [Campylobacterota bacterium]|nr:BspA family leucine-rich repeat surface protein [Campylobacterota bacterium]